MSNSIHWPSAEALAVEESAVSEIDQLIGEVSARTGLRLGRDDPAFAIVTLAQLVLRAEGERLAAHIEKSVVDFGAAAESAQLKAGNLLATTVRDCIREARRETRPLPRRRFASATAWITIAGAFAGGLTLGCLLR